MKFYKYRIYSFLVFCFLIVGNVQAKDKVLIATKDSGDFTKLFKILKERLSENYSVEKYELESSSKGFISKVKSEKPNLIIVMDNLGVKHAKDYYKETKSKIQTVAVMGLNFKEELKSEKNICGVSYEVPPYTLLTKARFNFKNKKVNRVLTFYRKSVSGKLLNVSKARLKKEGIELKLVDLEKVSSKKDDFSQFLTKEGLKMAKDSSKYDAVLVMLDSGILNKTYFAPFWLKAARESKVPFVVGTMSLVNPKLNFATFGMSPNLADLADQAAQITEAVIEDDESCEDFGVEDLIGVNEFWNDKKANDLEIKLNQESKGNIKVLN